MKIVLSGVAAILLVAGAAHAAPDSTAMAYTPPDQIAWKQDRPELPQYLILWGDPDKAEPYAMLVRWPAHLMGRPHFHPNDRHVVVVSGTWWMGTGTVYTPETATPLPAGTVVTQFANQYHYDGAKDEPVVLEITGVGPQ